MSIITKEHCEKLARNHFQLPGLYGYQRTIIDEICRACIIPTEERDPPCGRSLVLLPTGAGKSLCYMLPTLLIDGLSLILYPLNALIGDQMRRFREAGIPAAALTGRVDRQERRAILGAAARGEIKALLTNPETLMTAEVQSAVTDLRPAHIVLDEAHTVVAWGESFRPAYLEAVEFLRRLQPRRLSAFTATASPELMPRIAARIFGTEGYTLHSRSPARDNIAFEVRLCLSRRAELRLILDHAGFTRPAIIFCRTRLETEEVAQTLAGACGRDELRIYHAGISAEEKSETEGWFMEGGSRILAATCAFGLGVDCPGVRTVIHTTPPTSPEAYIQESGRAGRDGKPCRALVLLERHSRPAPVSGDAPFDAGEVLLHALNESDRCRRTTLMELFDPTEELPDCGCCDVCRGAVESVPAGCEEILTAVSRFRGLLSPGELADLLKGYTSGKLRMLGAEKNSSFGTLRTWNYEWIQEALEHLRADGAITGKRLRPQRRRRAPPPHQYDAIVSARRLCYHADHGSDNNGVRHQPRRADGRLRL